MGDSAALPELAAAARLAGVVPALRRLTAAARAAGLPVVHCTAADMPGRFGSNHNARLFAASSKAGVLGQAGASQVAPLEGLLREGDMVVPRFHGLSPLTGSPLDFLLRNEGVTTLVITGVSLNVAIPNLVFDAVNRSYQAVVVTDAVAGVPIEYGLQVIEHTLRPLATLATSSELIAIWDSDS